MTAINFWNRVNELLKKFKLTQKQLSISCNFSESRINNLSSTKRLPDAIEVVIIAKALQTTVEYLVTGKEPNQSQEKSTQNLKQEILDVISKY